MSIVPFHKLLSYFLLLASFDFAAPEADGPAYYDHKCTINKNFTSNSAYEFNLYTVFYSLSSNTAGTTEFYNTTAGGTNTNDTVYGLFMCRGDVPHQLCQDCVKDAINRIASECPYNKEAIIWYDECLVRYSDRSFFSTLTATPLVVAFVTEARVGSKPAVRGCPSNSLYTSCIEQNKAINSSMLNNTLNDVVVEAVKSGSAGIKKFATKEANFSTNMTENPYTLVTINMTETKTLYTLAQCTPDLSTQLCIKCLNDVMELIPGNNTGNYGRILNPSCNLRFETSRFYYKGKEPPSDGSREVAFPDFLHSNCSLNQNFTANDAYQSNLRSLTHLFTSSNITKNDRFYNATIVGKQSNTVHGLFMCRGDVSPRLCLECVNRAIRTLNLTCPFSKEAIVWYDMCMLRYSNRSFFSTLDTQPKFVQSGADMLQNSQDDINWLLVNTLNEVVAEASSGSTGAKNFATKAVDTVSKLKTLYTLAQCTPDLSSQECETCLREAKQDIPLCCIGKQGGKVMYPNCNLRFEFYRFYDDNSSVAKAPVEAPVEAPVKAPVYPPTPMVFPEIKGKDKGQSRTIIIVVVVLTVNSVMLFCFGYYCWRRKKSKSFKAILKENFGSEGTTLQSLQFSLATIEVATNKFSVQNRIGKGGFGEVYKGILFDGREIAVKRLSKSSGQGLVEFKNEVLLIAKLQHRNLVALLGFCLNDQEKILVYEYVPNKSLDYFLFGSPKRRVLNWSERYKIIGGIARGILYLHEYSRLKVIHRDLKPSNILLDDEMNPKISDFGMARMVAINEIERSTNRIVGTYGYMSPEYAMFGLFSEKSDVFSFGVIILEIISGKKNASCHDESQYADGLLSHAWKHWSDEKLLEMLDSNLAEVDSHTEIIKCIHIGLLCVQGNPEARPSMVTIVQYLSNDLNQLPIPQEPAFIIHGQIEPTIRAMEGQLANHSKPFSVNQMSESILFPR